MTNKNAAGDSASAVNELTFADAIQALMEVEKIIERQYEEIIRLESCISVVYVRKIDLLIRD